MSYKIFYKWNTASFIFCISLVLVLAWFDATWLTNKLFPLMLLVTLVPKCLFWRCPYCNSSLSARTKNIFDEKCHVHICRKCHKEIDLCEAKIKLPNIW